jgi:hypothetical protein
VRHFHYFRRRTDLSVAGNKTSKVCPSVTCSWICFNIISVTWNRHLFLLVSNYERRNHLQLIWIGRVAVMRYSCKIVSFSVLKKTKTLGKTPIGYKMCFNFFYNFFSWHLLFQIIFIKLLMSKAPDLLRNAYKTSCRLSLFSFDINQYYNLSTNFRKTLLYRI